MVLACDLLAYVGNRWVQSGVCKDSRVSLDSIFSIGVVAIMNKILSVLKFL